MSPAFSSRRQALAFAGLLAVLLALPALIARAGVLKRSDVYPTIAWKYGPFPWIQQQIFDKKGDVDMAFLGSSHILFDIDTPYVQEKLSQQLGRDADVFTLGWPWPGFDALYTVARDLLDHRHVHTLVIYDEGGIDGGGLDLPHEHSSRWFRMGENSEVLDGLPLVSQARLYGGAVLGMPRHLLSLVRPNLLEDPRHARPNFWNTYYRAPNLAYYRGAMRAHLAYGISPDFVPFQPPSTSTPDDAVIYSPDTLSAFQFAGLPTKPYALHFARALARLCAERGTQLIVLHLPSLIDTTDSAVHERENWQQVLGAPVEMMGIPPAKLFAGIPASDLKKLFFDDAHLNMNGQQMFTPLIAPALLKLYASH